jgi:hypothetical protein
MTISWRHSRNQAILGYNFSYAELSTCQFFSKIFPQRLQVIVYYLSMFYMQVPLFGGTLGLAGTEPVSGFVAGAFKPIFFNGL